MNPALPRVTNELITILGNLLANGRKQKKWRQIDLAERLNVSRQTIARMEKGDPGVGIGLYYAAAWILDISLFPGMEIQPGHRDDIIDALIRFLKEQLPQRVVKSREKPIDDDF